MHHKLLLALYLFFNFITRAQQVNFYEVLNISRNASQRAIVKAYRRKALKFHPDKSLTGETTPAFQETLQAYETLCDLEKRKAYDWQLQYEQLKETCRDGIGRFVALFSCFQAQTN